MKKYVTKGDLFKKGLIIRKYEDSDNYHIEGYFSAIELTEHDIQFCMDNDIIKELEEPEFTKSDLYNLAQFIAKPLIIAGKITDTYAGAKTTDWLKKRK